MVVSNQSGVARGLFDEAAVERVNRRVAELLLAADPAAAIDAFYYCPHLPPDPSTAAAGFRRDCECRKPRAGLFLRAARDLGLDLARSIAFGDSDRDVDAARAAGCARAVLVGPQGTPPTLRSTVDAALAELQPDAPR